MMDQSTSDSPEYGFHILELPGSNSHYFHVGGMEADGAPDFWEIHKTMAPSRREALWTIQQSTRGFTCADQAMGGEFDRCLRSSKLDLHHWAFNKQATRGMAEPTRTMVLDQIFNTALICHASHMDLAESNVLRDRLYRWTADYWGEDLLLEYLEWAWAQFKVPPARWWA